MPQYSPPPPTLDHLNAIQRYMQKGELERRDWLGLIALCVAYFVLRPYIQKAAKWWFSDAKMVEGEKAQKEYVQRRAKVGADAIRSGKQKLDKQGKVMLDDLAEDEVVTTSGSKVDVDSTAVNRKNKTQPNTNKSLEDQLLDWDDEPVGARVQSEKADVVEWLDKWDKQVEN